MAGSWDIRPRSSTLRRDFDPVRFWSKLTVVERHNVTGMPAGAWSVTARNEGLTGLLTAGNGVILFRDGVEIMSGPITQIERGAFVSTISGVSDTDQLRDRTAYPAPSRSIATQNTDYDVRTGPAETVALGYIAANAGPAALTGRAVRGLRIPVSLGRGKTVTVKARLGNLGDLVSDIAETSGLHMDVHYSEDSDGPYLAVMTRPVADKSGLVRFGTVNGLAGATVADDWSYTLKRPSVTDSIAAGGGQGAARIFIERVNRDAETTWGAKVESTIDQRQSTDVDDLADAAEDALADGSNPVSISFTITDSPDVRYRRDWQVGDRVGVNVDGIALTDVVREVTSTVQRQQGSATEKISAVVGSRDSSKWATKQNTQVAKALRAIDRLQAI